MLMTNAGRVSDGKLNYSGFYFPRERMFVLSRDFLPQQRDKLLVLDQNYKRMKALEVPLYLSSYLKYYFPYLLCFLYLLCLFFYGAETLIYLLCKMMI